MVRMLSLRETQIKTVQIRQKIPARPILADSSSKRISSMGTLLQASEEQVLASTYLLSNSLSHLDDQQAQHSGLAVYNNQIRGPGLSKGHYYNLTASHTIRIISTCQALTTSNTYPINNSPAHRAATIVDLHPQTLQIRNKMELALPKLQSKQKRNKTKTK